MSTRSEPSGDRPSFSKVLICDTRGDELAAYLTARRPELVCRVRNAGALTPSDRMWADALVGFTVPVALEGSSIRWVHSTGAGVDGLLHGHRWPAGVILTRTTGELGDRMAEYCVGHALASAQRIREFQRDQTERRWAPIEPAEKFGARGCVTVGVSRRGRSQPPFHRVHAVKDLAAVVPAARWLILAAPLTPETRRLVGPHVLSRCRAAFLINVARGGLLDTTALLSAIENGTLVGAVLDVFEEEPLPADSPLWLAPGVLITPHIAGVTHVAEAAEGFLDALTKREADGTGPAVGDPAHGY